jgi:capsule polysaccharide export protein KpsE/RkpR
MKADDMPLRPLEAPAAGVQGDEDEPLVRLSEILTWLGQRKRLLAAVTLGVGVIALGIAFLLPNIYTARATLLAASSQQQSSSSAALAALGALGGLAGAAGIAPKTSDDLYVGLLKSDSVIRALDQRFDLKRHYDVTTFEVLRKEVPRWVRVTADKKSGLISVEVDDESPQFAADLANAHAAEVTKLLDRLAVSEAQLRRVFFEKQLKETKENLAKAEEALQATQEKSGMIVLDKQAEALIGSAAQLRAQIAEREVQLKVLRTTATEQNPDVLRLQSELHALRGELSRMESTQGGNGSAVELPVGKIPAAAIDYVRARRELKIQETLLEGMIRQYEIAKLDEAKEGPTLQQVDRALPPDRKSRPSRAVIALVSAIAALVLCATVIVARGWMRLARERDPSRAAAWDALARAWRLRES